MPQIQEVRLAEELIRVFDDLTKSWFSKPQTKQIVDLDDGMKAAARELNTVRKSIEKHKLMFINDLIDIEELNNQLSTLKIQEKNLSSQLDKKSELEETTKLSPEELENLIYHFKAVWDIAEEEERKKLIASIFSKIVIDASEESSYAPGTSKHFWIVSAK